MAAALGARLPLAGLPPAALADPIQEWAFVLYNVPGAQVWHQRLRVASLAGSLGTRDFGATPDGMVYEECYHGPSADIMAAAGLPARMPAPVKPEVVIQLKVPAAYGARATATASPPMR